MIKVFWHDLISSVVRSYFFPRAVLANCDNTWRVKLQTRLRCHLPYQRWTTSTVACGACLEISYRDRGESKTLCESFSKTEVSILHAVGLLLKTWTCRTLQLLLFLITPITRHCHANNLPSTEQAVKTETKRDKTFSFIFHRFWPFICCLSVVLRLDKLDFPKNVHTVCPCYIK